MRNIMIACLFVLSGCGHQQIQETKKLTTTNADNKSKIYSAGVRGLASTSDKMSHVKCDTKNEKWKSQGWKSMLELGNSCVANKNFLAVESIGDEMSAQFPQAPWGAYLLSLSAESKSDFLRAHWMIDQAIKKSPEMGLLHYQKSRLLWMENENVLSVKELVKAVELDPYILPAQVQLAQIYFRDQEYARAALHFEAAIQIDAKSSVAWVGLGECRAIQKDSTAAIEAYEKAVALSPLSMSIRLRHAALLESSEKDYERALMAYREIQRLHNAKKLDGTLKVNITEKIGGLEKRLRSIASLTTANGEKK